MFSSSSWRRKLYDFRRNSTVPVASTIVSEVSNGNDDGVVSSAALIIAVLSGEEALKELKVPRNRGSKDSVLMLYLPEEVIYLPLLLLLLSLMMINYRSIRT